MVSTFEEDDVGVKVAVYSVSELELKSEIVPFKTITLSNGLDVVLTPTNYLHTIQSAKAVIEQNRQFRSIIIITRKRLDSKSSPTIVLDSES